MAGILPESKTGLFALALVGLAAVAAVFYELSGAPKTTPLQEPPPPSAPAGELAISQMRQDLANRLGMHFADITLLGYWLRGAPPHYEVQFADRDHQQITYFYEADGEWQGWRYKETQRTSQTSHT